MAYFSSLIGLTFLLRALAAASVDHQVESSEFYENTKPAVTYAADGVSQATAFVIQYTGEDVRV